MRIPNKVRDEIIAEAIKNSGFAWHSGWEKSSGYIKSDLRGSGIYGSFRIYIRWGRKKEPTDVNIRTHIEKYIDELLAGNEHPSKLRDFRHYLRLNYFVDCRRLQEEVTRSIDDCLDLIILALEKSDLFAEASLQRLHNDLKNYQCAKEEFESMEYLHNSLAEKMHSLDQEGVE